MTATVVGAVVTAVSQASTLTVTVPLPAGVQAGELVVLTVRHQGSGADALTVPAGWVALVNVASATNQRAMAIMALPVADPAGLPASVTLTRATTAGRYVAHCFRVAGANLTALNGGGSAAYATTAPAYTVSAWTASSAPGLAVYAAAHDTVSGTPAIAAPAVWSGGPVHLATAGSGGDSTTTSTTWLSTATLHTAVTAVPAGTATWNRGGGAGGGVGALLLDAPEPEPEPEPEPPDVVGLPVRAPGALEWLGASAVDVDADGSYRVTASAGTLTLELELLTPGRSYTLAMLTRATPSAAGQDVTGILDVTARPLSTAAARWEEWTTTAGRPVRLELSNVAELDVEELTLTALDVDDDELEATYGLSLELMVPRAGAGELMLDVGRLDRDALNAGAPWPGTLVLDDGALDAAYLYAPDLIEWWTPVLEHARAVGTQRGARTDGLVPVAEAGTLRAEFPNELDPRTLGVRYGTPVRLYHWPTRRALFTGNVTRAAVTPGRPGERLRYVASVEAVDVVGALAAVTRYGALVGVGLTESWRDRVARLMASAPEISWLIAPADVENLPTMANTVLEATLAAHLDVAAASARGAWWAGADGAVRICPGTPAGAPVAVLTDRATAEAGAWPYVDALAGWDTGELVTAVELVNLGASFDAEQGSWVADDDELTVTNETLAATYGRATARATVNVAPGEAEAIAAALARGQSSSAHPTAVTLDAGADPARVAAELELFAPVDAELRGERRSALLASVRHSITPRRWTTTLELLERP